MIIKNLTPHAIHLYDEKKWFLTTIEPSGQVARCTVTQQKTANVDTLDVDNIPLFKATFGEVYDLPDSEDGVLLIVSMMVRSALPERGDLCSPAELIRDEKGVILGSIGLNINDGWF